MRFSFSIGFVCLLLGCDNLNSSFDRNGDPSGGVPQIPQIAQKPKECNFDFTKTCWQDSVEKITSCLETESTGEVFTHSKEFCSNSEQKIVAFANPQDLFAAPMSSVTTPIDFRIFADGINECLHVSGTAEKFKVVSGQKSLSFDFTKDKMQFTCTDGQTVQIPYEMFEGCTDAQGEKYTNAVPGIEMVFSQNKTKGKWTFRLRGAPQSPDLFSCTEP